jgi:hypothetical protein
VSIEPVSERRFYQNAKKTIGYGQHYNLGFAWEELTKHERQILIPFILAQLKKITKDLPVYATSLFSLNYGHCSSCSLHNHQFCRDNCPFSSFHSSSFDMPLRACLPYEVTPIFGDLLVPCEPRSFVVKLWCSDRLHFNLHLAEFVQFNDSGLSRKIAPQLPPPNRLVLFHVNELPFLRWVKKELW